jgi:drug/metabolite transporter (DMT)-like permease
VLAAAFFSTAGPVARLAGGLQPVQIAFWRVAVGAAAVFCLALASGQGVRIAPRDAPRLLAYGAVLGLHFYLYISSLYRTSLDHALVLVNTAPVWSVVLSRIALRESFPASKIPGILVAIAGTAWLVGFDPAGGRASLAGDAMGLVSALAYAVYAVAGRRERERYRLLTYASWVYLGAALSLALVAPKSTVLSPVPPGAWPPLLALALLPTTLGHTLFNASIRNIHAAVANLIATQEVSGGMILGWLMLGETPSRVALIAWPVVLAGIAWVIAPLRLSGGRPPSDLPPAQIPAPCQGPDRTGR